MADVIWTIKAYEHVEEIGNYIAKDSPSQAQRVMQRIIKETRKLRDHIRVGKTILEVQEDNYREVRVFSYRILYKILNEDRVVILGVVHGQRLFDSDWLES